MQKQIKSNQIICLSDLATSNKNYCTTEQAPTKETQRPGISDRTRASEGSPGTNTQKSANMLKMVKCNFIQAYIIMSDRKTKTDDKKRKVKMHVMKTF